MTLLQERRRMGFVLLTPSIVILFVLILGPLTYTFLLSFQELNISNPAKGQEFVGLQHFRDIIAEPLWWTSLAHTVYFVAADLLIGIPMGLTAALMLNRRVVAKGVVFAVVLFPYVLAPVVNSLIWKLIYDPNYGSLNGLLFQFGIIDEYVQWLANPRLSMVMLIVANLWQGTPFAIVLFLAGLKTIPLEEYEAASIDGATTVQQFRFITIPHLKPIIYMNVVMKTILTFKIFDLIYTLTGGGPAGSTEVVSMLIYKESFEHVKFGRASAMSFSLLLIVTLLVIAYSRMFREAE